MSSDRPLHAAAQAHANIALVKYWGKADADRNLPATGSLSLTLEALATRTEVAFDPELPRDVFLLNGEPAPEGRVSRFLDLVRHAAGISTRARVRSSSNFPVASGLASSASGFSALAAAATAAAGLVLGPKELSALARQGSGSAARSIFGGFVEMLPDGFARPLFGAGHWDVQMVLGLVTKAQKPLSSTAAMEQTRQRSPYYPAWLEAHAEDLDAARNAIAARDLAALGPVMERSCLRMHAACMASDPGILFWTGATVELIACVRELRRQGTAAFFTIDAGPHVKVLCARSDASRVARSLSSIAGVLSTRITGPGEGVRVLEEIP